MKRKGSLKKNIFKGTFVLKTICLDKASTLRKMGSSIAKIVPSSILEETEIFPPRDSTSSLTASKPTPLSK